VPLKKNVAGQHHRTVLRSASGKELKPAAGLENPVIDTFTPGLDSGGGHRKEDLIEPEVVAGPSKGYGRAEWAPCENGTC